MPSLRQLRYFLAVADLAHFGQAAARLHVAQPALSRQIMALEEELGMPLLIRHTRAVSLTPAGQRFRQRAVRLLADLGEACDEVRAMQAGADCLIRVLHSSSVPLAGPLGWAFKAWLTAHPRLRVEIGQLASEAQVSELAEGRAEFGLARWPVLRRTLSVQQQVVYGEPLQVALPGGHALACGAEGAPLSLSCLAEEAFVFHPHAERGGLSRAAFELCQQHGFTPRAARVTSRKLSFLQLVALGEGIALIPESMCELLPRGVVARPLSEADACSQVTVLRRVAGQAADDPVLLVALDDLTERLGKLKQG